MPKDPLTRGSEDVPVDWRMVAQSMNRPYPVTLPMVLIILLVPFYILIAHLMPDRALHVPALGLDREVPLQPAWALAYGTLYLFAILLPAMVVRQEAQIRRTYWAYVAVWLTAYAFFFAFPTMAPRPAKVEGGGFFVWCLRSLYVVDPPFNCFPSLHVAHSFVSALSCYRVHRGVGIGTAIAATLIGVSTLFTKQHYLLDVVTGAILAYAAYAVFLRGYPREAVPDLERRLAPRLALSVLGFAGLALAGFWVAYLAGGG